MAKTQQAINQGKKVKQNPQAVRSIARSRAIEYALSVLHDADKLAFTPREYIFSGGTETVNGQTTEWCFAYGEAEWLAGEKFEDVILDANRFDDRGFENPNFNINLRTSCN